MNPADPKWLEILKASGWQTGSLGIAFVIILVLIKNNIIPTNGDPLWIALPSIFAIIFCFLCLGSIGSSLVKYFSPGVTFANWMGNRKKLKELREYIPLMSEKEKEIIGYLLYHNRRVFQADQDAGYAAPLLSQGIIKISARNG